MVHVSKNYKYQVWADRFCFAKSEKVFCHGISNMWCEYYYIIISLCFVSIKHVSAEKPWDKCGQHHGDLWRSWWRLESLFSSLHSSRFHKIFHSKKKEHYFGKIVENIEMQMVKIFSPGQIWGWPTLPCADDCPSLFSTQGDQFVAIFHLKPFQPF